MTSGPSTIARPACRYLGTTHDATVHCGYATRENVCYAAARRQSINLEFQETYCLGGAFEECARYQEAQGVITATASRPADVIAPVAEPSAGRGTAWRPLLVGIAGVIAVAILAFVLLRPQTAPASPSILTTVPTAAPDTPTALPLALAAPSDTPTAASTTAPTSTATRPTTPTSTSTRTPTSTTTATVTPSATAAATITPTVVITGPYLIAADVVNVREGPGVTYRAVGVLRGGQQWPVLGRNPAGDWVQGCCLAGLPGWITTQFVTISVPIDDLPIIEVIAPITPTATITVTATITP